MNEILQQIRNETTLRWHRVNRFKPQIRFSFEVGNYLVKTAETLEELRQSFKLRNEVFNIEFRGIDCSLDVDRFDTLFDHLIIIDKPTMEIVGTYRLKCFDSLKNSYTALEFDLTHIISQPGPHLELGRACIQQSHRKGSVISLLWRGITEYMKLSGAQVLFGCSSVKVDNPRDASLIYQHLENEGFVSNEFLSHPQKEFLMEDFETWRQYFQQDLNTEHALEAEALVPSLLKSYVRLGARIVGEPAYDADYDCIDFLTVLKRDSLDNALARKYRVK
jgi:putative hemolysin